MRDFTHHVEIFHLWVGLVPAVQGGNMPHSKGLFCNQIGTRFRQIHNEIDTGDKRHNFWRITRDEHLQCWTTHTRHNDCSCRSLPRKHKVNNFFFPKILLPELNTLISFPIVGSVSRQVAQSIRFANQMFSTDVAVATKCWELKICFTKISEFQPPNKFAG